MNLIQMMHGVWSFLVYEPFKVGGSRPLKKVVFDLKTKIKIKIK
jgi:hypothetical protein